MLKPNELKTLLSELSSCDDVERQAEIADRIVNENDDAISQLSRANDDIQAITDKYNKVHKSFIDRFLSGDPQPNNAKKQNVENMSFDSLFTQEG